MLIQTCCHRHCINKDIFKILSIFTQTKVSANKNMPSSKICVYLGLHTRKTKTNKIAMLKTSSCQVGLTSLTILTT